MNLNPLKKDDNTDALVKALEDANNMTDQPPVAGGAAPSAPAAPSPAVDNAAAIAADPQVASAGVTPDVVAESAAADTPSVDTSTMNTSTTDDSSATDQPPVPASTDSPVSFSDDNKDSALPGGISDDADAHLPSTSGEGSGDGGELDDVKKSALEQLRPLIEKLDLEPADKFDKYLMMLRASDDPALIKPAFDAAQGIGGEKEKAQALLDIINEINYITNQQN